MHKLKLPKSLALYIHQLVLMTFLGQIGLVMHILNYRFTTVKVFCLNMVATHCSKYGCVQLLVIAVHINRLVELVLYLHKGNRPLVT